MNRNVGIEAIKALGACAALLISLFRLLRKDAASTDAFELGDSEHFVRNLGYRAVEIAVVYGLDDDAVWEHFCKPLDPSSAQLVREMTPSWRLMMGPIEPSKTARKERMRKGGEPVTAAQVKSVVNELKSKKRLTRDDA